MSQLHMKICQLDVEQHMTTSEHVFHKVYNGCRQTQPNKAYSYSEPEPVLHREKKHVLTRAKIWARFLLFTGIVILRRRSLGPAAVWLALLRRSSARRMFPGSS